MFFSQDGKKAGTPGLKTGMKNFMFKYVCLSVIEEV